MTREGAEPKQLALSIALKDDCTLDTFYPGDNLEVLAQIQKMGKGQGEQFIFLWGREGVGRTHLLQGACHFAVRGGLTALYLPLGNVRKQDPAILFDKLESLALVCLDDLDSIVGEPLFEEALFYLFNRLRAADRRLIIAASAPPKNLLIKLADLQSRLAWGVTYQIQALSDDDLLTALQLRAKQRGLALPQEVGAFLIKRSKRSMPELYGLLEKLDNASLAQQRRLTVPFVKTVLGL